MASSTNAAVARSSTSVEASTRSAGWTPVANGALLEPEVLALGKRDAFAGLLFAQLCNISETIPGVFVSAGPLAWCIAQLVKEEPQRVEQALGEMERRGLIVCEGGAFFVPSMLAPLCAAPTTRNQIGTLERLGPWPRQVRRLGPRLRKLVTDALLDVTARADAERARRRKPGADPLFEQLKRALGVGLVSMPSEPPDPQLSLPLGAVRPEVRLVQNEDLEDPALCWLSLVEREQGTVKASCGAGNPPDVRPVGPEQPSLVFSAFLPRGETTLSGTPFQSGEQHGQASRETGSGRPVAAQTGHAAGALPHVEREAAPGGAPRDGARPAGGGWAREVQPRPEAGGADSRAGQGVVSAGLRADQKKLGLLEVWNELRRLIPELAPQRRYRDRMSGEISTGLPGKQHHALVEGFLQTQEADPPAKLEDFQLIAAWVRAGGLHYLQPTEWCAHICAALPVVLEKAAAWKAAGKKDPRAPEKPASAQEKPAAGAHYHAPAKRWITPELRRHAESDKDEGAQHISEMLKRIAGGQG